MKKIISDPVFLICSAVLLLCVGIIEFSIMSKTNNVFMYPLDDTFIHMVVAKNLAFHGVWGMNHFEFGSASSSLFYTLLLAGLFKVFSVNVLIPFIVNIAAGLAIVAIGNTWLRKQELSVKSRIAILTAVIFFTPLPVMIISGMEHTLQCLFTFMFIIYFSDYLQQQNNTNIVSRIKPGYLFILGMFVVFIRYEGLFVIGIAALILLLYRKLWLAVKLGLLSTFPVIVFGFVSVWQGSYFLPNSVIVKSDKIQFTIQGLVYFFKTAVLEKLTLIGYIAGKTPLKPEMISLLTTQYLILILPVLFLLFRNDFRKSNRFIYFVFLLAGIVLMHLTFASTGWFYRYEAYLVMSFIFISFVIIFKYGKFLLEEYVVGTRIMAIALFLSFFAPITLRSLAAFSKSSQASVNIYEQQYQMALFAHRFYLSDVIAMNDIGAVSFMTEGRNVDLWGLGSIEVAKSKKEGYYSPAFMDSLCTKKGVSIAMVYDTWFTNGLLNNWKKVATWQIQNNVICGDSTVSFYAVNTDKEGQLIKNLKEFESSLPKSVIVEYY